VKPNFITREPIKILHQGDSLLFKGRSKVRARNQHSNYGISSELAEQMLGHITEKRKRMPLRNKIVVDAATRNILAGNKRTVSRRYYKQLLETEYKKLKTSLDPRSWKERRTLRQFIDNTMMKMYIVS
jgi:hypothetical protein